MYFNNLDNYDEDNDGSFQEESEQEEEVEEETTNNVNRQVKLKYNEEEEITDENESNDDEVVTDSDYDRKSGNDKEDLSQDKEMEIEEESERDMEEVDINIDDEFSNAEEIKLNELLFCVQGIGNYTDDKKSIYEKGKFCEPSMKDIHRFLRKDDPENPECRFNLLNWKTAENEIIPLILNYENNEKIQQLGLVLLVDITEALPDLVERRPQLESMLTQLQEYIVNSKLIELLSRSLADYTAKLREASIMRNELMSIERQERRKFEEVDQEEVNKATEIKKKIAEVENKSETMIELIFVLFKQILNIIDSNSIKTNVTNNITLLRKLSTLKIFDAIVFHSQSFDSEFSKRLSTTILELLFFLIRPFSAQQIHDLVNDYNSNKKNNNRPQGQTLLQKLMEEEKQQKMMRQAMMSHRPNNFGTMIKISRPMDNSSFIVSNINMLTNNKEKYISTKLNEISDQKKKPRKGMRILKNKKIPSKASEEIKLVNDIKIHENFSSIIDYTYGDVIVAFKKFCEDFLKNCLNALIRYFFIELKLNEKVEKYDYYHIVSIMTFFLDINRLNEYALINDKKEKTKNEKNPTFSHVFNAETIMECLSSEMIDLCYSVAYMQSLKASNNDRKLFELYSSIRYLKQVLLTGFDLYKYRSDFNLEMNVIIQDNLVTKDFAKIIRALFNFFNENYHPKKLLYESIQLAEIYFTSLDLYSHNRKLKKKLNKKKIKEKEEDEDEDEYLKKLKKEDEEFIEKDNEDNEKEDDEHTGSVSVSEESKIEYLEKDLNIAEELRVLIDYNIISRIFSIFNINSSFNSDNITTFLNELKYNDIVRYTAKLFERITKILNEPWIFYQMEYLYIMHSLLNESLFSKNIYFNPIVKVFNDIIKSFFSAVNKNKLLPIESLFRFPSFLIKDSILNNYDEIEPESERYQATSNRNDIIDGYDNDYADDEVEYDGNNIEMVKAIDEQKDIKKKREKKKEESEEENPERVKWTEKEDLLLIQNYSEFSEFDNFHQMLDQLFPLKNLKEIKTRIKTLKLKKGTKKAMKVFKKIHKKRKQKEEKLFNIIIEISDECRNESKKRKIENTISSLRQQLESYKVRKGLLDNSTELECVLIPNTEEEIDVMQDRKFQQFIKNLGLIPPDEDYLNENKCWRVDPKSDVYEISIIIEKLENFERVINENVEIEDPVREEERKRARKEKKMKKKHKKDKKDKKKKKKKRKEEYKEKSQRESDHEEEVYKGKKSIKTVTRQSVEHSVISERSEIKNNRSTLQYSAKKSEKKSNLDNLTVKNSVINSSSSKKTRNEYNKNNNLPYEFEDDDVFNDLPKNSKKKKLRKGLKNDDDYNFD